MALTGAKFFKVFGSLCLCVLATLAVWKEMKLSQNICDKSSTIPSHGDGNSTVLNYGVLARRPARHSPVNAFHGAPALSNRSYILNTHHERSYARIESADIALFVTSPPSSGMASLLELLYALPIARRSRVLPLINTTILSTENNDRISQYVHKALQDVRPPAFVHTHAHHVDIPGDLRNKTLLMSVVRDPIERAVSLYNYARANSTHRDSEQLRKWREQLNINRGESYDDCVRLKRSECVSENAAVRLVRHFCGYDRRCRRKTRWALDRAKRNIENNYYMIGTREDMAIFIQVIERRIPSMFSEGSRAYNRLVDRGKIARIDRFAKVMPSEETVKQMKVTMALDVELYEWIKARFNDEQIMVGIKI